MKGDITVRTKWGIPILDELYSAIDYALAGAVAKCKTKALLESHRVKTKAIQKAFKAVVEAWQGVEDALTELPEAVEGETVGEVLPKMIAKALRILRGEGEAA